MKTTLHLVILVLTLHFTAALDSSSPITDAISTPSPTVDVDSGNQIIEHKGCGIPYCGQPSSVPENEAGCRTEAEGPWLMILLPLSLLAFAIFA